MARQPTVQVRTNDELAALLDIDFTMASRLRNGKRLPSADLMNRMHEVLGLPLEELHRAREAGQEEFGRFMRERVYMGPPKI